MRKILLLLLLQISMFNQLTYASDYTSKEEKLLTELRPHLISMCMEMASDTVPQMLESFTAIAKTPSVKAWVSNELLNSETCSCVANAAVSKMTPEFLRRGSSAEQEALATQSTAECAVPKVKTSYANFCKQLIVDLSKLHSSITERAAANFCNCTEQDVAKLTPNSFGTFSSLPGRGEDIKPGSLYSTIRRCGKSELGVELFPR